MKKIGLGMMAAALASVPAMAQDASKVSYSAGYTHFMDDGDTFGAATGRVTYAINSHISLEGEVGVGVTQEKETFGSVDVEYGIDSYAGGFVVGTWALGEKKAVFGRVGYASVGVSAKYASGGPTGAADNTQGFAYGVGGKFALTSKLDLRGDYTIFDTEDGNVDALSISLVLKY